MTTRVQKRKCEGYLWILLDFPLASSARVKDVVSEKILMFRFSELDSAAALKTGWRKPPPHTVEEDDRPCNCKHVPYCHPPLRMCAVVYIGIFTCSSSSVTLQITFNVINNYPKRGGKMRLFFFCRSFPTPEIQTN